MKLTCYYRTYSDENICDGDIDVEMSMAVIECAPTSHSVNDAIGDLVPYFAPQGPLEWSCGNGTDLKASQLTKEELHSTYEWLTLVGRNDDYRIGADQYFEVSLHGPLQVLKRFESCWNK